MTTEQTITIHHEPPPEGIYIVAYCTTSNSNRWIHCSSDYVILHWDTHYTAWYDPQVGEPVKARRYEVRDCGDSGFAVEDKIDVFYRAFRIPTRSAAQAIADIYERAAEGGEG